MHQLTFASTDAQRWREQNPEAWAAIIEWAHEDAAMWGRCSMQTYIEALRSPALARRLHLKRTDATYAVNHNLRSELTDLALADYPHLPFRTRRRCLGPDGAAALCAVVPVLALLLQRPLWAAFLAVFA